MTSNYYNCENIHLQAWQFRRIGFSSLLTTASVIIFSSATILTSLSHQRWRQSSTTRTECVSSFRERERVYLHVQYIRASVSRFGEISPFGQYFKSLRRLCERLFGVGQNFEPALVNILCHWANFHCCIIA